MLALYSSHNNLTFVVFSSMEEDPGQELVGNNAKSANPTNSMGEEYVSDSELDELLDGELSLNKAHHQV